jgi:hypothetical protein
LPATFATKFVLSNRSGFRRVFGYFLCVLSALGAFWSVRLALADRYFRQQDLAAVAHAVLLAPGNARYHVWLAELQDHEGNDPASELSRATKLNPLDSSAWIRMGLRAELLGNTTIAQRDLLQAAKVDKQYDPRWTLANFYARQQRPAEFWESIRQVLTFDQIDLRPAFDLCWNFTGDAAHIARLLPQSEPVLRQYLAYTIATTRAEAAGAAAKDVLEHFANQDAALLAYYCRWTGSVEIWNALCRRRLVPFPPTDPGKGRTLTDGDFTVKPEVTEAPRAFQWTMPPATEIYATRLSPGLRFSLSGNQPEKCELLAQSVPVSPNRSYRFRFEYQTGGLPAKTGLHWNTQKAQADLAASEEWKNSEMLFHSTTENLVRLVLAYARVPGTIRTEGTISIRGLTLEFAE